MKKLIKKLLSMVLFLVVMFFTLDMLIIIRNNVSDSPANQEIISWPSLLNSIGLPTTFDWFILVVIVACLYPVTRGWILEGLSSLAWLLSRLFDLLMYIFGGLVIVFYSFAWLSKRITHLLVKTKQTAEFAQQDKNNYLLGLKAVFQNL